MQNIFQKIKVPMIIIGILFGGFIVYNTFVKAPVSGELIKKDNFSKVLTPEQDFLPLLLRIQNVTLDEKLFLDPVFRALVDLGQDIKPEPVGKPNPFLGIIYSFVNSSVESLGFKDEKATTTPTPKILPKPVIKK